MVPRDRSSGGNIFAERLNQLFERARLRGEPFTNEDVERLSNGVISANHVWRLRNGRNPNPGFDTMQTLARVFGVGLDYFAATEAHEDELAIKHALAQPELRSLVVRLGTAQLNRRDSARLLAIVDAFLLTEPQSEGDE